MIKNTTREFTSDFGQINILDRNGIYCKKTYLYDDIAVHNHNHYEIEFCVAGSCEHWLNGTSQEISAGNIIFLGSTDIHHIHVTNSPLVLLNTRINHLELQSDLRLLLLSISNPQVGNIPYRKIEQYVSIFENLEQALISNDPLSYLAVQGNFFLLLSELLHSFPSTIQSKDGLGKYNYVNNAICYINEHYNEPIKLSDIATNINISSNYLSEIFNEQTGLCISDYLTQVRVLYAKSFLESTSLSITDIASAVGFNSFSSFSRSFKKICGISPSQYLALKKDQNDTSNTHYL